MVIKDEEELQALAEQWQTALRLKDWDVEVRLVRSKELGPGKRGDVMYDAQNKDAVVRLLDPRDEKVAKLRKPLDHELTLVHELLHLHWAGVEGAVKDGPLLELVMEQGVAACSNLMVELLRAAKTASTTAELAEETTSALAKHKGAAKRETKNGA